jgi:hypothetical protein
MQQNIYVPLKNLVTWERLSEFLSPGNYLVKVYLRICRMFICIIMVFFPFQNVHLH